MFTRRDETLRWHELALERFRGELDQVESQYVNAAQHEALIERIERVEDVAHKALPDQEAQALRAQYNSRLEAVERWQATMIGRGLALALIWSIILAAVTALTTHLIGG